MKMVTLILILLVIMIRQTQPDKTGKTIPLEPELLKNQSKNCHLEEQVSGRKSSENMLKGCIKRYLKSHIKPQKHSISWISKSEKGTCTTKTRACF